MAGPPIKKSFPLTLLQLGRARSRVRSILCGQNISNTLTIWQLSAGDEKSVPAWKISIFIGHGGIDSILGSYSEPEFVNVQVSQELIPRNRIRYPT
jgi:hypothetical protein